MKLDSVNDRKSVNLVTVEIDDFETRVSKDLSIPNFEMMPEVLVIGGKPFVRNHTFNAVYQTVDYLVVEDISKV